MSDPGHEQTNLLDRLRRLQEDGEALADSLRTRERRVRDQLAEYLPPNPVEARVELDDRGFIQFLEVSSTSDEATPDDYLQAINSAIVLAQVQKPTLPPEAVREYLSALREGEQPPSAAVTDDFRNITVTAVFGDVRSVEASAQWLRSSPDKMVSEEILRIAQDAARQSDRFDRFSGENNG